MIVPLLPVTRRRFGISYLPISVQLEAGLDIVEKVCFVHLLADLQNARASARARSGKNCSHRSKGPGHGRVRSRCPDFSEDDEWNLWYHKITKIGSFNHLLVVRSQSFVAFIANSFSSEWAHVQKYCVMVAEHGVARYRTSQAAAPLTHNVYLFSKFIYININAIVSREIQNVAIESAWAFQHIWRYFAPTTPHNWNLTEIVHSSEAKILSNLEPIPWKVAVAMHGQVRTGSMVDQLRLSEWNAWCVTFLVCSCAEYVGARCRVVRIDSAA